MFEKLCDLSCTCSGTSVTSPTDFERGLPVFGILNVLEAELLVICASLDRGLSLVSGVKLDVGGNALSTNTCQTLREILNRSRA